MKGQDGEAITYYGETPQELVLQYYESTIPLAKQLYLFSIRFDRGQQPTKNAEQSIGSLGER